MASPFARTSPYASLKQNPENSWDEGNKRPEVSSWTEDEVEQWLDRTPGGGKQIARAAKAARVNGHVLQEMDSEGWDALGVTGVFKRMQLAAAIKQAAEGKVSEDDRPISTRAAAKYIRDYDLEADPAGIPLMEAQDRSYDRHRIQCRCAIHNLNVHNFADSQTFEAFIKFEASWEDNSPILKEIKAAGFDMDDRIVQKKCANNKLVVLGPDGCECSEPFAPRIMFKNRVKEPRSKEEWYSLSKWTEEKPTVRWFCHFTGVFNMREASLRKFPLDEQMLTIEVQTGWPLSPSADAMQQQLQPPPPWRLHGVELLKHKGDRVRSVVSVGTQSFAMKNEYRLTEGIFFDAKESEKRDSASGLEFSLLAISVHVRRKSGFWFNNVFLPSWIITSSVLSSYSLPRGGGGRLVVSVLILLTLTIFKSLAAHKLPDVDYMTLIDWYFFLSYIFVFSIIFEQTLSELGSYNEGEDAFQWSRQRPASSRNFSATQGVEPGAERIMLPAPLVNGVLVWWGFHVIVLCLWGFFYARRMLIDPRRRVCMGRRWGQDGCDWFEPELNSMRNLLIHIGIGQDRVKQPPGPLGLHSNRQVPTRGGGETEITSSGVSAPNCSTNATPAISPRGDNQVMATSPVRSWGPEGYLGTAPPDTAVRL